MKNVYNKGTFRSYEWGKIPTYLKKYGNKKWRRTEISEIEDQLSETVRFFKQRRKRQKLIRLKLQEKLTEEQISITEVIILKNHLKAQ